MKFGVNLASLRTLCPFLLLQKSCGFSCNDGVFTHPLAPSAREGESNAKLSAREGVGESKESPRARVGESKIPLIAGKIREVWQIVNARPSFLYIAIVNYKIPPPLRRGIKGVGRFWIA